MTDLASDDEPPVEVDSGHLEQLEHRIGQVRKSTGGGSDESLAGIGLVFSLGLSIVTALLAGDWLGRWLAEKTGIKSMYMVCLVVFLVVGCWSIYRQIRFFSRMAESKDK